MATMPEPLLVDTNVLLRWADHENAQHLLCFSAVENLIRMGRTPCVVPQNLVECWNVLTRPRERNGFGLRPEQADNALKQIELRFRLHHDTLDIYLVWRRIVVEAGVSGVQVHDARLAACMLVHGIERILTFNTDDFTRYAGIKPIHPRDVAAR